MGTRVENESKRVIKPKEPMLALKNLREGGIEYPAAFSPILVAVSVELLAAPALKYDMKVIHQGVEEALI